MQISRKLIELAISKNHQQIPQGLERVHTRPEMTSPAAFAMRLERTANELSVCFTWFLEFLNIVHDRLYLFVVAVNVANSFPWCPSVVGGTPTHASAVMVAAMTTSTGLSIPLCCPFTISAVFLCDAYHPVFLVVWQTWYYELLLLLFFFRRLVLHSQRLKYC